MKPSDILKDAKRHIDTPVKWAQGGYAYGSDDFYKHLDPEDPQATCFCAGGAIYRACPGAYANTGKPDEDSFAGEAFKFLNDAAPWGDSVAEYNDAPGRKHKTVMKWFDRAIALAEEAGE